jgi:circadian clock protein KaiC
MIPSDDHSRSASTGVAGLDEILGGGLPADRIFLVEGNPGAGKTTLALQFLLDGARRGESVLYLTLSESARELTAMAASHGWSLDGIAIREYVASEAVFGHEHVSMYHAAEVELGETLRRMLADIDTLKPRRLVLDALSELRLLAETSIRYRRQLLAFKQFFLDRGCTVLLLDDRSQTLGDPHVQSVLHGAIELEVSRSVYGKDRRTLRIGKLRGRAYASGMHDYEIRRGGLEVFPRLIAAEHHRTFDREPVSSGVPALDALLGGGPQWGTSTLLLGPAGVGKTTTAMLYALAAVRRGERASVYLFDEAVGVLRERLGAIGLDVDAALGSGRLRLTQVDPAELSPGEFAHRIRRDVEQDGHRVVVIDSLNGYLNAMPEDRFLTSQLHELLAFLANRGVLSLLIVGQQGIVGPNIQAPIDASYLADSVVLFRFFEADGRVRKAISAAKKRGGSHENLIRELTIDARGVHVGEPLKGFRGVLTGHPEYSGELGRLADDRRPPGA